MAKLKAIQLCIAVSQATASISDRYCGTTLAAIAISSVPRAWCLSCHFSELVFEPLDYVEHCYAMIPVELDPVGSQSVPCGSVPVILRSALHFVTSPESEARGRVSTWASALAPVAVEPGISKLIGLRTCRERWRLSGCLSLVTLQKRGCNASLL